MESNKIYSLSELFSTNNRKIIIPDFQRDYCWGDEVHGANKGTDIVSSFMDTLFEEFEESQKTENKDVLLGKIDVYENPQNHIYLTDGQQRLTTLYLLIGMLYKQIGINELKKCLISEHQNVQEPYLHYSIRESTIFFLRDLVIEFFIAEQNKDSTVLDSFFVKEKEKLSIDPNKTSWFFNEYTFDPSIVSIINALRIIEDKLKNINDKSEFSTFVLKHIKILYYDVVNRKHGEERFVIINTTGKTLEETENLKPILVGGISKEFSKQWEDRETYFWKNRGSDEKTADAGVKEFMQWCFSIIEKKDAVDLIKDGKIISKDRKQEECLLNVNKLFIALKKLLKIIDDEQIQKQLKFVTEKDIKNIVDVRKFTKDEKDNILLPLLSFINKIYFNDKDENTINKDEIVTFLRRLRKNYFDKKWTDRKDNYIDWRYILQIIEKSESFQDCMEFDNFEKENVGLPIGKWYNNEELLKNTLRNNDINAKALIEEWEDNADFMGDITPLIKVSKSEDINLLNEYYEVYCKLNVNDFKYSEDVDLKNLYRLHAYLTNGHFVSRTVGGKGYLMLENKNELRTHLQNDFFELWKVFKTENHDGIKREFDCRLKKHFSTIIKSKELDENSSILSNYETTIRLWCILEYINNKEIGDNIELNFDYQIALYWDTNLNCLDAKKDEENDFRLGNICPGISWYNNKSGEFWMEGYPLMKEVWHCHCRNDFSTEKIEEQNKLYYSLLKKFLQG